MLGWFVGRTLRRNALRDLDTAQNVMTLDARLAVARRVIAQMTLIERRFAEGGTVASHCGQARKKWAQGPTLGSGQDGGIPG
jgi:hypothetical protein